MKNRCHYFSFISISKDLFTESDAKLNARVNIIYLAFLMPFCFL